MGTSERSNLFIIQVFGWMTLGLFLTAIVALVVNVIINASLIGTAVIGIITIGAAILQLILAVIFGFLWQKLPPIVAAGGFLFYTLLSGFTIGLLVSQFTTGSIFIAFLLTAILFLALAIFGLVVKTDLTGCGMLSLFGLVGVILVSIVNLILYLIQSPLASGLNIILNYITVILFLGLVAYDAQRIKALGNEAVLSGQSTILYAVKGALMLYIDVVNLFVRILLIIGGNRRRN
jgi:uncharacterized protein